MFNSIQTPPPFFSPVQVMQKIFGESQAIVLYIDSDKYELVDYKILSLSEIIALLNSNGFGESVHSLEP